MGLWLIALVAVIYLAAGVSLLIEGKMWLGITCLAWAVGNYAIVMVGRS